MVGVQLLVIAEYKQHVNCPIALYINHHFMVNPL